MRLYEINAQLQNFLDDIDGEITDDNIAGFHELEIALEDKALDTACYIKSLVAESEALKSETKVLRDRTSVIDAKIERLKKYIGDHVEHVELQNPRAKITWRKSTRVEVDLEAWELPLVYQKNGAITPKKDLIKSHLLEGRGIRGCSIVEHENIQIK